MLFEQHLNLFLQKYLLLLPRHNSSNRNTQISHTLLISIYLIRNHRLLDLWPPDSDWTSLSMMRIGQNVNKRVINTRWRYFLGYFAAAKTDSDCSFVSHPLCARLRWVQWAPTNGLLSKVSPFMHQLRWDTLCSQNKTTSRIYWVHWPGIQTVALLFKKENNSTNLPLSCECSSLCALILAPLSPRTPRHGRRLFGRWN